MSLYDDLDSKDSKSDVSGWSSGFKLLQSQLQAKKASLLQTKRQRQNTLAPVVDLKRNSSDELHFNQLTGKLERIESPLSLNISSPFIAIEPHSRFAGVDDEYNPLYPNEYDEFVKKRREQRQRDRDNDRRNRDNEDDRPGGRRRGGGGNHNNGNNRNNSQRRGGRDNNRRREDNDDESEFEKRRRMREDDEENDYEKPRPLMGGGAAIAPPKSLIEDGDDSPDESGMNAVPPPYSDEKKLGMSMGLSGSVASKIMAKYGYKEGQGLGKLEQGMSTALMVEKTSKRGGKIIHEKDIAKFTLEDPFKIPSMDPTLGPNAPRAPFATTDVLRNPSKVILLQNMVGPGEVDEDLEPETAEECTKYGKVIKCVIFEMPNAVDDEAVRIFIEFERQESAIKAVVDLNGRYFGGRVVKAGFFNVDRFRRLDLGGDL